MRHDHDDGVDRRLKPGLQWEKPTILSVSVSRDEVVAITGSKNPKAALRDFYHRRVKSNIPKRTDD